MLDVPDTHGRYYVIQLLDAYSNTFAYVGRRTTGTKPGATRWSRPASRARCPPACAGCSPTNLVWVLGRTLVKDPADIAAAAELMAGYRITALDAWNAGTRSAPLLLAKFPAQQNKLVLPKGLAYLDELGQSLEQNPPPARDRCAVKAFEAVGIGPGHAPSTEATGSRGTPSPPR